MNDFTHRDVPRLCRRLFRLGLSGSFGLDEAGCREALGRVQYVFWSPRMKALTYALRDALARDRNRYVISAGPLLGYFPGAVRRAAEGALRTLGVGQLDVFQLYWLGKVSAFTGAVREEMAKLREEGKVRALGVSIHDRPRAGKLAEDSILDFLMIRYNAAHSGAEQEIFPHLAQATSRPPWLGGEGSDGGGLLPVLPFGSARGRGAHRAAERDRVAGEPGGARKRSAFPPGDGGNARVRARRARVAPGKGYGIFLISSRARPAYG